MPMAFGLDIAHPRDAGPGPRARPRAPDGQGGPGDGGLGAAGASRGGAALPAPRRAGRLHRSGRLGGPPARRRGAPRRGGGRGRGRVPAGQDEDQARPRRGSRPARPGAIPRPAADGRRQHRLHPRRRRAPPGPRRVRADDDRAAPGLGRHRGPRDPAEAPRDRRCASTSRSARPPTPATLWRWAPAASSTSRSVGSAASRGALGRPRRGGGRGGPGLVRGHGGVRHRPAGQRAPADAARASPFPATPRRACGSSTRTSWTRRWSSSPDGTIAVPEGPGIGHEIVWPRVERATRLEEAWTRP